MSTELFTMTSDIPIIDSHIHLYAERDIPSLNWTAALPDDHVLKRTNGTKAYKCATAGQQSVNGFIFVETDRGSGLEEGGWQGALDEVDFLLRIARGVTRLEDGSEADDGRLVRGIVPWAPLPTSPDKLEKYVAKVLEASMVGTAVPVVGFRYLLQDKPAMTMLHRDLIDSLEWLGQHGFTFDLGVDAHHGGFGQLEKANDMMISLYSRGSRLRIVLNHFCKPNLRLEAKSIVEGHPDYTRWKALIQDMARHRRTYMKLSGFFSELPAQSPDHPETIEALLARIKPWTDVVFASFGPSRIMFGSDWPVCNVGGPGVEKSWQHWHDLVAALLRSYNLSWEDQARIWHGTAIEAYGLCT